MDNALLPNNWRYKELLSYQKSDVIYRITYYFAHKYLQKGDRTIDQMIQAARSGKQNIVEGCAASITSTKTEMHFINVAKASLRELLLDYEDFLFTQESLKYGAKHPKRLKRCTDWEESLMMLNFLCN